MSCGQHKLFMPPVYFMPGAIMTLTKKLLCSLFCLLPLAQSAYAAGGIAMSATRVIYQADKKEASLTVSNRNDKEAFLIQAWAEDVSGNKKTPFVITPPLFRLDPAKDNVLRIVHLGAPLPQDRESVYWINVKAIPSTSEASQSKNVLQIAVRTRLKLFYRPVGLPGNANDAYRQLTFTRQGNQVVIHNPTPYTLSFDHLAFDGRDAGRVPMVPAKGQVSQPLPAGMQSAATVTYSVINDFGASSDTLNQPVKS